jgi:predicted NBD/HSP70 family sugar kinase/lambda repressor-like predicted transcriptional regulator
MSVTDTSDRPGSQAALHSANRGRIVQQLMVENGLTQAQLARRTGLAPATVSNIIRELTSAGALEAMVIGRARRVRLTRAAGLVVGVDYGHRHVTVAVADRAHEILAERHEYLQPNLSAADGLGLATRMMDDALAEIHETRSSVVGVGMGLPAPINVRTGQVGAPSILPGWYSVNAVDLASEHFGRPVIVDNDANLGALAEYSWGAGRGFEDIAFVKLAEGVGAGLVLGGRIFHGRDGTAGEVGHITTDEFGPVCRCGNRGCVETAVAARRVVDLLEPTLGPGLTIAEVVDRARHGHHGCLRVLEDTGRQAGIAVANLANVFNPERILIGGELAQAGDFLLAPLREMVRRLGIPSATSGLDVLPAALGAQAAVLGAVALALESAPVMDGDH